MKTSRPRKRKAAVVDESEVKWPSVETKSSKKQVPVEPVNDSGDSDVMEEVDEVVPSPSKQPVKPQEPPKKKAKTASSEDEASEEEEPEVAEVDEGEEDSESDVDLSNLGGLVEGGDPVGSKPPQQTAKISADDRAQKKKEAKRAKQQLKKQNKKAGAAAQSETQEKTNTDSTTPHKEEHRHNLVKPLQLPLINQQTRKIENENLNAEAVKEGFSAQTLLCANCDQQWIYQPRHQKANAKAGIPEPERCLACEHITQVTRMRTCVNCGGWGHLTIHCPSPPYAAIEALRRVKGLERVTLETAPLRAGTQLHNNNNSNSNSGAGGRKAGQSPSAPYHKQHHLHQHQQFGAPPAGRTTAQSPVNGPVGAAAVGGGFTPRQHQGPRRGGYHHTSPYPSNK
eukprot:TRINITY_DN2329_c0_g1_i1.p1 TRINITY_DN2329_c0_g1~~TRINITY_DN2329_c0_g1_i1.p1  ORF type:complete len:397 (+),score=89.97 TRINITY_DN2329_c0_g1_i1:83-1273(+)